MKQQTVIVTGLVATFPVGGVVWDYMQYLLGFLKLGHDAYYLEDSGNWTFDPVKNTFTDDATANAAYLADCLQRLQPGLEKRFCFRDTHDRHWGLSREELQAVVKRASVFINISTTCQLREEYAKIPVKVLIDSDPLYTQASIPDFISGTAGAKEKDAIEQMLTYDFHFSFGEHIGKPFCKVPSQLFNWRPTRQPTVLDCWGPALPPARNVFTTVLSWQPVEKGPVVNGIKYGGKNIEFEKFIDLPQRTSAVLELALGGGKPPREKLAEKGWRLVDGYAMSSTPWKYREYIQESMAEFSMAKNAYAATRSGWFSCRSACYLAAGRPVVVQDTGFSEFIPTGEGIIAFTTVEEALEGIVKIGADWERHSKAARKLAQDYFDSDKVLGSLMRDIGLS
jgi:hypothetical protein